jgi:hypothetical protein
MSNTTQTTNKTPIIFLDQVGRTIMGVPTESECENIINVQNPVVIIVGGDSAGKMSVQLFPLFFREFLGDKNFDAVFSFRKDNVTLSNVDAIDFRLQAQYNQMFSKNNSFVTSEEQAAVQQTQESSENKTINLFDE